jgi:hypothetical protein
MEVKRLRLDPDYVPSTASEGTTAANIQITTKEEEESRPKLITLSYVPRDTTEEVEREITEEEK